MRALSDRRYVALCTFDIRSYLKSWRGISNCSAFLLVALSAEPGRKKAYSGDICWRVVYQRIGMHLTFEAIARNLNIATSTTHRIYSLFDRTGSVNPQTNLRSIGEFSVL